MSLAPPALRWIRTAPSRVASALRSAADLEYSRSLHLVVSSRSGADAFAMFGGHRLRHHFARVYFGNTKHHVGLRWHRANLDAAVFDAARQYGLALLSDDAVPVAVRPHTLRLPFMVELEKALPEALLGPGLWTRSALHDISRVHRSGLRMTVEQGTGWIPTFLRDFATPSMNHRHGIEGYTPPTRLVLDMANEAGAELIRVWRGDECVGAILNNATTEGYRLCHLGWRNGDDHLLRDHHVVLALYWFSLMRAHELGAVRCFFGGARPYLEDGLVFFKAKWGATLDWSSRRYPDVHLLLDPAHESCRRFLDHHSLIARGYDDRFVVFSRRTRDETRLAKGLLDSVARWYRWRDERSPADIDHPDVPDGLRGWVEAV